MKTSSILILLALALTACAPTQIFDSLPTATATIVLPTQTPLPLSLSNSGSLLVFRRFSDPQQGIFEVLAFVDGNPDQQISLGHYRGVPAISRDGNYLAVSCLDDSNKLCIVDIQETKNKTADQASSLNLPILKTVELPESCTEMLSLQGDHGWGWPIFTGVDSISWSYDDTKLAVVCKKIFNGQEGKTCILPLDESEESVCWELPTSIINVTRAEWSPVEDLLIISEGLGYGVKIYLIDPSGQNPRYLTEGWGASWSPDGKQIAFIQWAGDYFTIENDGHVFFDPELKTMYTGVATINIDGSNLRWLYKPGEDSDAATIVFFNCADSWADCNTTWSPDGKYIAFNGVIGGAYNYNIFKISLDTGEIIRLTFPTNDQKYSRSNSAPNWGK
ncbi:MAG: PD40 domain-containing protein [Chloroflexi bacterium]|nr:PD40 domain-containing protein [Chloroflexota bacterium]